MKKAITSIEGIAVVLFLTFVAYGIHTDCPNTAGYVYCAPKE